MSSLISIENFDNFRRVIDFPPSTISSEVVSAVQSLDEREEIEPFIRSILSEISGTPHGPAEIVDILTHKVVIDEKPGIAAYILKGKSFPKVRPTHVAHQIYRLEKITPLNIAVFAVTGILLDAAKEQFISTAQRVAEYYAIFDIIDLARLFVSYGFLCPRDGNRIAAGRCQCGYSPTKRVFNIFQHDTLKILSDSHRIGQKAGLVVLPPGSGKTRIAAEDAKAINAKSILYVAHTHEILDVAESELCAAFGADNVIRHDKSSLKDLSLANLSTIQLLKQNINQLPKGAFDYVIIDEFHHAAAKSYRQLIDRLQPNFLLGLTATPFRTDRQDILELCERNTIISFELRTGIESGILTPYHYFGCFDDIDYTKIHHNGIRYDIRDLERELLIPERDEAIIAKWKELANDKPTIAFCCSHRHAQRAAKNFKKDDIPAEIYISDTPSSTRKSLLSKFRKGTLKILCVVDVLNEGADIPYIECLLFLRPTESSRIFYQQLGRGLRRYIGKSHCVAIDFIGNFKNAYKIVEYQGLLPFAGDDAYVNFGNAKTSKELLNLPLGCQVHFDDRVIDIFAQQTLDPKNATRHNIGRILLYEYKKLARYLNRLPTKRDVDRSSILGSDLYVLVFGTWSNFERLVRDDITMILE